MKPWLQHLPLCDIVQGKRWKMSPCKIFKELFPGAREQALPFCLCSSAKAEQGMLQGHHQRLCTLGLVSLGSPLEAVFALPRGLGRQQRW